MVSFVILCFHFLHHRLSVPLGSSGVKRVLEIAEIYTTATFVSVDFKPLSRFVPQSRIEFEVYKLLAGFDHPDASFDFVHAGHCVTMVSDIWA